MSATERDHYGRFICGFYVNLWEVNVLRAKIISTMITIEKEITKC